MRTRGHTEIERTYDPGPAAVLPALDSVTGGGSMGEPVHHRLAAVYFDTADLDLDKRGITLRRRTGWDDAGWHLKLPVGGDTRTEVQLPPGRATRTVPDGLLAPVRGVVRDRELLPVARVETRRSEHPVVDAGGVLLTHVCVDEVHAERLVGAPHAEDWHEWEVELDHGDEPLLDAVEGLLLAAGATRRPSASKLLRTLDDLVLDQWSAPPGDRLPRGSAGDRLVSHLAEQREQLLALDARLRTDEPDAVHQLRVTARRLRSALATYRSLLEPGTADRLRHELRWLGQVLGVARDAQVLRERLGELVAGEPAELVLGPVARRIDDDLSAAYQAGRTEGLAALDGERYFRLLDALDAIVTSPALTPRADGPATEVLAGLLRRDLKRLRRAVRAAARADGAAERDAALHEARKKAKRLRYAAEVAAPVLSRAGKLASRAKSVQQALGEHQDSVVARERLREYATQTQGTDENGFTYGRLHALEQARGDAARSRFDTAYQKLTRVGPTRWTRA